MLIACASSGTDKGKSSRNGKIAALRWPKKIQHTHRKFRWNVQWEFPLLMFQAILTHFKSVMMMVMMMLSADHSDNLNTQLSGCNLNGVSGLSTAAKSKQIKLMPLFKKILSSYMFPDQWVSIMLVCCNFLFSKPAGWALRRPTVFNAQLFSISVVLAQPAVLEQGTERQNSRQVFEQCKLPRMSTSMVFCKSFPLSLYLGLSLPMYR